MGFKVFERLWWATPVWECPVKESMFYLFPSWVKHSVERNNTDSERISIAFNFVSPNQ
jgi:hypothetical protein